MASKTTTYIVRIDNADGFDARSTSTKTYSHAVVVGQPGDEGAISWHGSRELARSAADGWKTHGYPEAHIVETFSRNGAKATVVKQLQAELAEVEETDLDPEEEPAEAKKAPAKKAKGKKAPAKVEEGKADPREMAGYRVHTKSRSTKTTAVLVDGEAADLDTDGGRWQLICLDHDFIVADSSQRHARDVLSHPEEWCGPCGKAFRKAAKSA